ncbi:MAG: transposase [Sneathiella sp.]
MSTGKKRFWSDDEKWEICGQTGVEGASVAQVARRYEMIANLIHKWLRDPHFGVEPENEVDVSSTEGFLPVEIEDAELVSEWIAPVDPYGTNQASLCATCVDLSR